VSKIVEISSGFYWSLGKLTVLKPYTEATTMRKDVQKKMPPNMQLEVRNAGRKNPYHILGAFIGKMASFPTFIAPALVLIILHTPIQTIQKSNCENLETKQETHAQI